MNSLVSLMGLIAQRARGTRGAKIVVTNVDIRRGHMAGVVRNFVEAVDCLYGGGNPDAAGKQYGLLHLRKGGWAIVGFTSNVCGVARVDDGGAGRDDDRIVGKGGGEGERGSGSLVGVHIGMALLSRILLGLAGGRALAMVGFLLLLLASLLLLWWPVPPLLLLLELGVPRVALDGANLVRMVT